MAKAAGTNQGSTQTFYDYLHRNGVTDQEIGGAAPTTAAGPQAVAPKAAKPGEGDAFAYAFQNFTQHQGQLVDYFKSLGLDLSFLDKDGSISPDKLQEIAQQLTGDQGPLQKAGGGLKWPKPEDKLSPKDAHSLQKKLVQSAFGQTELPLLSMGDQEKILREYIAKQNLGPGNEEQLLKGLKRELNLAGQGWDLKKKISHLATLKGREMGEGGARLFQAAVEVDPKNAGAQWRLGAQLLHEKPPRLGEARSCFEQALQNTEDPHITNGILKLLKMESFGGMLRPGETPDSFFGDQFAASGRSGLAKGAYQRALDKAKEDPALQQALQEKIQWIEEKTKPHQMDFTEVDNPHAAYLYEGLTQNGIPPGMLKKAGSGGDRKVNAQEVFAYASAHWGDPRVQAAVTHAGLGVQELPKEWQEKIPTMGLAQVMGNYHRAIAKNTGDGAARAQHLSTAGNYLPDDAGLHLETAEAYMAQGMSFAAVHEYYQASEAHTFGDEAINQKLYQTLTKSIAETVKNAEANPLQAKDLLTPMIQIYQEVTGNVMLAVNPQAGALGNLGNLESPETLRLVAQGAIDLGKILEGEQNRDEAMKYYQTALDLTDRCLNKELRDELGKNKAKAEADAAKTETPPRYREDLAKAKKEDAPALMLRSNAYLMLGKFSLAHANGKKAAELDPGAKSRPGDTETFQDRFKHTVEVLEAKAKEFAAEREKIKDQGPKALPTIVLYLSAECDIHEALGHKELKEELSKKLQEVMVGVALGPQIQEVQQMAEKGLLTGFTIQNFDDLSPKGAAVLLTEHKLTKVSDYVEFKDNKVKFNEAFQKLSEPGKLAVLTALRQAGTRADFAKQAETTDDPNKKLFFEAQTALCDGNLEAARVKMMDFKKASRDEVDPEILKMREKVSGELQQMSLAAVKKLQTQIGQMVTSETGEKKEDIRTSQRLQEIDRLKKIETLLQGGKVDTVDEGYEYLAAPQKAIQANFDKSSVAKQGTEVDFHYQAPKDASTERRQRNELHTAIQKGGVKASDIPPNVPAVHLGGGTVNIASASSGGPAGITVVVGKEGGVANVGGYSYTFKPGDKERVVYIQAGVVTGAKEGEYGRSQTRIKKIKDAAMDRLVWLETRPGLEAMRTPEGRANALMETAVQLRDSGEYRVASDYYEAVFGKELDAAHQRISSSRLEEIKKEVEGDHGKIQEQVQKGINEQKANPEGAKEYQKQLEEFRAALLQTEGPGAIPQGAAALEQKYLEFMVKQSKDSALVLALRKEAMAEMNKGGLKDERAAKAWSQYNDMEDPTGEWFNYSDATWDMISEEAVYFAMTSVATLGVGSAVRAGLAGSRLMLAMNAMEMAGEKLAADAARGLGSRLVGQGIRLAGKAAPTVLGYELRSIAEGTTQSGLDWAFKGQPFGLKQIGFNIAVSHVFHGGAATVERFGGRISSKAIAKTAEDLAEAVKLGEIPKWQATIKIGGLKAANEAASLGMQSTVQTVISYPQDWLFDTHNPATFWDRFGEAAVRMTAMHFGQKGLNVLTARPAMHSEALYHAQVKEGREWYRKLRSEGFNDKEARARAGAHVRGMHIDGTGTIRDSIGSEVGLFAEEGDRPLSAKQEEELKTEINKPVAEPVAAEKTPSQENLEPAASEKLPSEAPSGGETAPMAEQPLGGFEPVPIEPHAFDGEIPGGRPSTEATKGPEQEPLSEAAQAAEQLAPSERMPSTPPAAPPREQLQQAPVRNLMEIFGLKGDQAFIGKAAEKFEVRVDQARSVLEKLRAGFDSFQTRAKDYKGRVAGFPDEDFQAAREALFEGVVTGKIGMEEATQIHDWMARFDAKHPNRYDAHVINLLEAQLGVKRGEWMKVLSQDPVAFAKKLHHIETTTQVIQSHLLSDDFLSGKVDRAAAKQAAVEQLRAAGVEVSTDTGKAVDSIIDVVQTAQEAGILNKPSGISTAQLRDVLTTLYLHQSPNVRIGMAELTHVPQVVQGTVAVRAAMPDMAGMTPGQRVSALKKAFVTALYHDAGKWDPDLKTTEGFKISPFEGKIKGPDGGELKVPVPVIDVPPGKSLKETLAQLQADGSLSADQVAAVQQNRAFMVPIIAHHESLNVRQALDHLQRQGILSASEVRDVWRGIERHALVSSWILKNSKGGIGVQTKIVDHPEYQKFMEHFLGTEASPGVARRIQAGENVDLSPDSKDPQVVALREEFNARFNEMDRAMMLGDHRGQVDPFKYVMAVINSPANAKANVHDLLLGGDLANNVVGVLRNHQLELQMLSPEMAAQMDGAFNAGMAWMQNLDPSSPGLGKAINDDPVTKNMFVKWVVQNSDKATGSNAEMIAAWLKDVPAKSPDGKMSPELVAIHKAMERPYYEYSTLHETRAQFQFGAGVPVEVHDTIPAPANDVTTPSAPPTIPDELAVPTTPPEDYQGPVTDTGELPSTRPEGRVFPARREGVQAYEEMLAGLRGRGDIFTRMGERAESEAPFRAQLELSMRFVDKGEHPARLEAMAWAQMQVSDGSLDSFLGKVQSWITDEYPGSRGEAMAKALAEDVQYLRVGRDLEDLKYPGRRLLNILHGCHRHPDAMRPPPFDKGRSDLHKIIEFTYGPNPVKSMGLEGGVLPADVGIPLSTQEGAKAAPTVPPPQHKAKETARPGAGDRGTVRPGAREAGTVRPGAREAGTVRPGAKTEEAAPPQASATVRPGALHAEGAEGPVTRQVDPAEMEGALAREREVAAADAEPVTKVMSRGEMEEVLAQEKAIGEAEGTTAVAPAPVVERVTEPAVKLEGAGEFEPVRPEARRLGAEEIPATAGRPAEVRNLEAEDLTAQAVYEPPTPPTAPSTRAREARDAEYAQARAEYDAAPMPSFTRETGRELVDLTAEAFRAGRETASAMAQGMEPNPTVVKKFRDAAKKFMAGLGGGKNSPMAKAVQDFLGGVYLEAQGLNWSQKKWEGFAEHLHPLVQDAIDSGTTGKPRFSEVMDDARALMDEYDLKPTKGLGAQVEGFLSKTRGVRAREEAEWAPVMDHELIPDEPPMPAPTSEDVGPVADLTFEALRVGAQGDSPQGKADLEDSTRRFLTAAKKVHPQLAHKFRNFFEGVRQASEKLGWNQKQWDGFATAFGKLVQKSMDSGLTGERRAKLIQGEAEMLLEHYGLSPKKGLGRHAMEVVEATYRTGKGVANRKAKAEAREEAGQAKAGKWAGVREGETPRYATETEADAAILAEGNTPFRHVAKKFLAHEISEEQYFTGLQTVAEDIRKIRSPAYQKVRSFLDRMGLTRSGKVRIEAREKLAEDIPAKLIRRSETEGWSDMAPFTDIGAARVIIKTGPGVDPTRAVEEAIGQIGKQFATRDGYEGDGTLSYDIKGKGYEKGELLDRIEIRPDKQGESALIQGKKSGYRARHVVVEVAVTDIDGSVRRYPIEIQVTTDAHAEWGGIQHELVYKAPSAIRNNDALNDKVHGYCKAVSDYLAIATGVLPGELPKTRPQLEAETHQAIAQALASNPALAKAYEKNLQAMADLMDKYGPQAKSGEPPLQEAALDPGQTGTTTVAELLRQQLPPEPSEPPPQPSIKTGAEIGPQLDTGPRLDTFTPKAPESQRPSDPGRAQRTQLLGEALKGKKFRPDSRQALEERIAARPELNSPEAVNAEVAKVIQEVRALNGQFRHLPEAAGHELLLMVIRGERTGDQVRQVVQDYRELRTQTRVLPASGGEDLLSQMILGEVSPAEVRQAVQDYKDVMAIAKQAGVEDRLEIFDQTQDQFFLGFGVRPGLALIRGLETMAPAMRGLAPLGKSNPGALKFLSEWVLSGRAMSPEQAQWLSGALSKVPPEHGAATAEALVQLHILEGIPGERLAGVEHGDVQALVRHLEALGPQSRQDLVGKIARGEMDIRPTSAKEEPSGPSGVRLSTAPALPPWLRRIPAIATAGATFLVTTTAKATDLLDTTYHVFHQMGATGQVLTGLAAAASGLAMIFAPHALRTRSVTAEDRSAPVSTQPPSSGTRPIAPITPLQIDSARGKGRLAPLDPQIHGSEAGIKLNEKATMEASDLLAGTGIVTLKFESQEGNPFMGSDGMVTLTISQAEAEALGIKFNYSSEAKAEIVSQVPDIPWFFEMESSSTAEVRRLPRIERVEEPVLQEAALDPGTAPRRTQSPRVSSEVVPESGPRPIGRKVPPWLKRLVATNIAGATVLGTKAANAMPQVIEAAYGAVQKMGTPMQVAAGAVGMAIAVGIPFVARAMGRSSAVPREGVSGDEPPPSSIPPRPIEAYSNKDPLAVETPRGNAVLFPRKLMAHRPAEGTAVVPLKAKATRDINLEAGIPSKLILKFEPQVGHPFLDPDGKAITIEVERFYEDPHTGDLVDVGQRMGFKFDIDGNITDVPEDHWLIKRPDKKGRETESGVEEAGRRLERLAVGAAFEPAPPSTPIGPLQFKAQEDVGARGAKGAETVEVAWKPYDLNQGERIEGPQFAVAEVVGTVGSWNVDRIRNKQGLTVAIYDPQDPKVQASRLRLRAGGSGWGEDPPQPVEIRTIWVDLKQAQSLKLDDHSAPKFMVLEDLPYNFPDNQGITLSGPVEGQQTQIMPAHQVNMRKGMAPAVSYRVSTDPEKSKVLRFSGDRKEGRIQITFEPTDPKDPSGPFQRGLSFEEARKLGIHVGHDGSIRINPGEDNFFVQRSGHAAN